MGHKRSKIDLTSIDGYLHHLIIDDIESKNSLILASLMKEFSKRSNSSPNEDVYVKDILQFMRILNKDQPMKISRENARSQLKSMILAKLSNVRLSSETNKRSSFKVSEILAYCEMLRINPATIFLNAAIPTALLPVQYCTPEQITTWLQKASCCNPVDVPTRISYRSAPILGVSVDICFSYSLNKTLNEMILNCCPIEVEFVNTKAGRGQCVYDESNKNRVQMQAFISFRANYPSPNWVTGMLKVNATNGQDNKSISSYLQRADHYFFSICQKEYKENREQLCHSIIRSDQNIFAQYHSDNFTSLFMSYLNDNLAATGESTKDSAFISSKTLREFDSITRSGNSNR